LVPQQRRPLRSFRQACAAAPTAFSAALESTLHRALANADQRKHECATLEHPLLALPAAYFLQEQGMTSYDAINDISDGIIREAETPQLADAAKLKL
jgi:hypothetical protein